MRSPFSVVALAGFVLAGPLSAQGPAWRNGVVRITTKTNELGTGFVVALRDGKAYIVTAAHVIPGDPRPQIEFVVAPDRPHASRVRHQNPQSDLAVLIVDSPPTGVTVLPASTREPGVLDRVAVAGFPVDTGIFSGLDPSIKSNEGLDLVLTRAAEPGFSGGPVLLDGAVVGMIYGTQQDGRAVHYDVLRRYLKGLGVDWESDSYVNPKDGLTYRWIPAGRFRMGCSPGDSECDNVESPAHDVEITRAFRLGESEVTQAAWKKVMKTDPSRFKGDELPVESVSWDEARRYCAAIGGRLPTEAEWEYAARAGTTGARYEELDRVAWNDRNSEGMTHPVKQKPPNAWGLYDMLGNVWEWNEDWWYGKYEAGAARDPKGPQSGTGRVVRGGAWINNARHTRASFRNGNEPDDRSGNLGFRCAEEFP